MAEEVTKTDINTLMAMDPLKHTRSTINEIVAHMRQARHVFNTLGKTTSLKKPSPKKLEEKEAIGTIDLASLLK